MRKSVGHQCGAGRVQVRPNYDLRPELMFPSETTRRRCLAEPFRWGKQSKYTLMVQHGCTQKVQQENNRGWKVRRPYCGFGRVV